MLLNKQNIIKRNNFSNFVDNSKFLPKVIYVPNALVGCFKSRVHLIIWGGGGCIGLGFGQLSGHISPRRKEKTKLNVPFPNCKRQKFEL